MPVVADCATVESVGLILNDSTKSLAERYRALFTLRNLGGDVAVRCIAQCFEDDSELLKHECAYCLGQMQSEAAIPYLMDTLKDTTQQIMVRHEAGEALGAIGHKDALNILQQFSTDPVVEIAETCQLAVERVQWLHGDTNNHTSLPSNPYQSVDPAPPCGDTDITQLTDRLLDEHASLFHRYRAMFTLRNIGTTDAVLALSQGLRCRSALFRHEVAYVLGQMQHVSGVPALRHSLEDSQENPMVRHECAEALGAIATPECMDVLTTYRHDDQRIVKESCEVALDMAEYENSGQFQYADSLERVQDVTASS